MTNEIKINKKDIEKMLGNIKVTDDFNFNNLMNEITKQVIHSLVEGEMTDFLGFKKNQVNNSDNSRNGHNKKKVKTKTTELEVKIPRDRKSIFEPKLIKKRQTDISSIDQKILSLYSKGLSTNDIKNHIKDIYGYAISKESISNITDCVIEDAKEWQSRPLKPIYSFVFIDAFFIYAKTEGSSKNMAVYAVIGIDLDGKKDCLGIWIAETESAKFWLNILNDMKSRGVKDILFISSDNLTAISSAIKSSFPNSFIQKCIVHQIRNSVKFVNYKDRKDVINDLKNIYKAINEEIALEELEKFALKWDKKYPYISKSWNNNWAELSLFFNFGTNIRKMIYTTNAIESFNSQIKRVIRNKQVFPNELAVKKLLFLAISDIIKKWTMPVKNWVEIYNELIIHFEDRINTYVKF